MALKDVEFNTHWSLTGLLFWFSDFPPIPLAISFRSLSGSFPQFFFKYWGSSRFLLRFSSLFTPQPFPGRVRNSSTYWWHPHVYLQVGFLFLSIRLSTAHKTVSCGCSTGPNILLWTLLPSQPASCLCSSSTPAQAPILGVVLDPFSLVSFTCWLTKSRWPLFSNCPLLPPS